MVGFCVIPELRSGEKVGITARGEYFSDKKDVIGFNSSIFATTLSFDIKPVLDC
jgi:hypothetical protein